MPLPLGFVPPCLPTKAPRPPTGEASLHEIKHDGFRVVARKDGERVRLYSRPGNDLSSRRGLFRGCWSGAGIRLEPACRHFPS